MNCTYCSGLIEPVQVVCRSVIWVLKVSEVESCQQPSEEAGPLGSEEADKEVDHCGDKDDARGDVVQVVESLLIGHHVQVPASYSTNTHRHTGRRTQIQMFSTHTLFCLNSSQKYITHFCKTIKST